MEQRRTVVKSSVTSTQAQLPENHNKDCHNEGDKIDSNSTKIIFPCKGEEIDRLKEIKEEVFESFQ